MLSIYYFSYVHLKILRLIKKDSNKKKKIEKEKYFYKYFAYPLFPTYYALVEDFFGE